MTGSGTPKAFGKKKEEEKDKEKDKKSKSKTKEKIITPSEKEKEKVKENSKEKEKVKEKENEKEKEKEQEKSRDTSPLDSPREKNNSSPSPSLNSPRGIQQYISKQILGRHSRSGSFKTESSEEVLKQLVSTGTWKQKNQAYKNTSDVFPRNEKDGNDVVSFKIIDFFFFFKLFNVIFFKRK